MFQLLGTAFTEADARLGIEALTLQIEAVRCKRSAERAMPDSISAYPHLCHSTCQAYRGWHTFFHSIRYIDSISRVSSIRKNL